MTHYDTMQKEAKKDPFRCLFSKKEYILNGSSAKTTLII